MPIHCRKIAAPLMAAAIVLSQYPMEVKAAEPAYARSDILLSAGRARFLYGFPDGRAGAAEPLTRAQAAMMLYLLAFQPDRAGHFPHFTDVPPGAWYAKAVGYLQTKYIINVPEDGKFRPEDAITGTEFKTLLTRSGFINSVFKGRPPDTVTRAEAAAILNKILGRTFSMDKLDKTPPHYTDLKPHDKGYADIIRASMD